MDTRNRFTAGKFHIDEEKKLIKISSVPAYEDFLTASCRAHYKASFNPQTCPEVIALKTLKRCFECSAYNFPADKKTEFALLKRFKGNSYVREFDLKIFADIAPQINEKIKGMRLEKKNLWYKTIFESIIQTAVNFINQYKFVDAYILIKEYTKTIAQKLINKPKVLFVVSENADI